MVVVGGSADGDCARNVACQDCLKDLKCGWCPDLASRGKCLLGDASGPTEKRPCYWWRYNTTDNCADEDACLPFRSCSMCTSQLGCGWCGSVCLSGTPTGPNDVTAFCPSWSWKIDSCQAPDCSKYTTCSACAKQHPVEATSTGCGWCGGQDQKCINGNITGPGCPGWTWNETICQTADTCGNHKGCQECVSDSSMRCAWCSSTGRCLEIASEATQKRSAVPTNNWEILKLFSECSDLRYGTCQKSCYHASSCEDCMKNPACGMCGGFCTRGDKKGPTFLPVQYCSPWNYGNQTCEQSNKCEKYSDCETCSGQGCHWCPSSGCMSSFDVGCCAVCKQCLPPQPSGSLLLNIVVGVVILFGTAATGLLLSGMVYGFWEYYWKKRHYFETLS
eukprot:TRINITY_DN6586_c0_g1_i1.p1 TRINITY_DN6586_c0_g1~~TRINITY_DN6586_c0_g1_i1.p1  ORF type:complete len:403 (+),score=47.47 TRINITY_DN6586_c0_g1_i1:42-1211(+)